MRKFHALNLLALMHRLLTMTMSSRRIGRCMSMAKTYCGWLKKSDSHSMVDRQPVRLVLVIGPRDPKEKMDPLIKPVSETWIEAASGGGP